MKDNDNKSRILVGYVKESMDKQLTYLVVSDSGHLVPYDQPFSILEIVYNWLQNGLWDQY